MKNLFVFIFIVIQSINILKADLCLPKYITSKYDQELSIFKKSPFSQLEFLGDPNYNKIIINCNRKRDTLREKISNIALENQNLDSRIISGKILYYGVYPMPYGYLLDKKKGKWNITIFADFDFPILKNKNYIDISISLAEDLGIWDDPNYCGTAVYKQKKQIRGKLKKNQYACRLNRFEKIDDMTMEKHLFLFWKRSIESSWSNDEVNIDFLVNNLGEISSKDFKKYKKENIVWPIHLNFNPTSRAVYQPVLVKRRPLYSGISSFTVIHEVGHMLGLDDEYPEFQKNDLPDHKSCGKLGGIEYIMCGITGKEGVKGIYHWIITRRYWAGKVS
jgi:hypothetical protein